MPTTFPFDPTCNSSPIHHPHMFSHRARGNGGRDYHSPPLFFADRLPQFGDTQTTLPSLPLFPSLSLFNSVPSSLPFNIISCYFSVLSLIHSSLSSLHIGGLHSFFQLSLPPIPPPFLPRGFTSLQQQPSSSLFTLQSVPRPSSILLLLPHFHASHHIFFCFHSVVRPPPTSLFPSPFSFLSLLHHPYTISLSVSLYLSLSYSITLFHLYFNSSPFSLQFSSIFSPSILPFLRLFFIQFHPLSPSVSISGFPLYLHLLLSLHNSLFRSTDPLSNSV